MIYKPYFTCLGVILLFLSFFMDTAYPKAIKTEKKQADNPTIKPVETTPGITMPEIIKLNENILQIGKIIINKKKRYVSINGEVNMSDGLVEYFACDLKGKLHESVLSLHAEPYHIQVALLLLGLKQGKMPIEFQGAPERPCGDPLYIAISWKEGDKTMTYSPEELIININTKKTMDKSDWVFTGSKILDGRYMAQVEGSIMAIYHDPFAIIDHISITGADDTLFHANKDLLPSVGTPIIFKIFPQTNQIVRKRVKCKGTGE